MKNYLIVFYLTLGIFLSAESFCFAQSAADASASVTIVTPITISQTDNLIFGNISIPVSSGSASTGSTVTTPVSGVITQTGSSTLSQGSGTTATASFNVTGQASSAYSVTLPATTVTLSNGSDVMTASTFTTTTSSVAGTVPLTSALSNTGNDVVKVGASLNVNANQSAGLYTAANPFTVTINYN